MMVIPTLSQSTADTCRLYDKPGKWTQEHLRIANLQLESEVPIGNIVTVEYIPSDEDTGKFALSNRKSQTK